MALKVDPRGMTFIQWAARTAQTERNIPQPVDGQDWHDWARAVAQVDASAPNPEAFVNWGDWVLAWIRSE